MKNTYFLRSGEYNYQIDNLDLYSSFDVVAQRIVDPPLTKQGLQHLKKLRLALPSFTAILCSPTKRSSETAHSLGENSIEIPELFEISYHMSDFIDKFEFYDKYGKAEVNKARQLFVQALIQDQLHEPYNQVIQRIKRLFDYIESMPDTTIGVISHGFYLKVIESYCKNPTIEHNREKLLETFSGKEITYHFNQGFLVQSKKGSLSYISEIK